MEKDGGGELLCSLWMALESVTFMSTYFILCALLVDLRRWWSSSICLTIAGNLRSFEWLLIMTSAPVFYGNKLAVPAWKGKLGQDSLPSFNVAKLDGLIKGTMCSNRKTCVTFQHTGNPCIWDNILHILKKQKLHFFVGCNNHYRANLLLSWKECYFWILIRIKKKCC